MSVIRSGFWVALSLIVRLFADSSIVTFENDPSAIVEGAVNVITGEPIVFQEDLVIQGAEPIRITRAYLPGPEEKWFFGILGSLYKLDFGYLEVTEKSGAPVLYKKVGKEWVEDVKYTRYEPANLQDGFSNTSQGKISSRTNLKNNYLLLNKAGGEFEIHCADGTVRTYRPDVQGYHLESERLPNGNWILYEYDVYESSSRIQFKSIRSTNPEKTKIYAQADVCVEDTKMKNKHFVILGSDGSFVEYLYGYDKKPQRGPMSSIHSSGLPTQHLSFIHFQHKVRKLNGNHHAPEECRLESIRLPLNREFKFGYYRHDTEIVANQTIEMDDYWIAPLNSHIDPRRSRISTISSQVGADAKLQVTHSFIYDLKNNKTSVIEIDGNRTDYHWDRYFRIDKIERYSREDELLNAEKYLWGWSGQDFGNLWCKTFLDGKGTPILSRRYFYDNKGNILEERLYGNLSGRRPPPVFDKNGMVVDGEFYAKTFKYSSEDLSLLTEQSDGALRVAYGYLPETDLLTSELTYDGDALKMRKFWEYDRDRVLVREISDDGSSMDRDDLTGVKVRTIRQISHLDSGPYIGMPRVIEEKYLEHGSERLLKKIVLTYGTGARIVQKDIYDARGVFRYSLKMDYDEKGRLIRETNALGQIQSFEYDECGNQIVVKDFSGQRTLQIDYDHSNRPTVMKTGKFVKKISYDLKHRPVSEIDPRAHQTKYTYDLLGRCIKTEMPLSWTSAEYDAAGNTTAQIDAEGHRTDISYNAYGKPVFIRHPDGTQEHYSYNLNGSVHTHTDERGVTTQYVYDYLGRIVQKNTANGKVIEEWEYRGDLLVAQIDAEGNRTTYDYDGAGRKVLEELDGEKIAYSYDSLGRLVATHSADCTKIHEYDLLDRIIEEREESNSGEVIRKIQYEYDESGNQKSIIRFVAGKKSREERKYDFLDRLIEITDSLGNTESILYDDWHKNSSGQQVLQKIHLDPMGLRTIETMDAQGRLARLEKRKDHHLLIEEKFYDLSGRLHLQTDQIFDPERKTMAQWDYDSRGRLSMLTEENQKRTRYAYTARGELAQTIKSDGSVIAYEHDDLGNCISIQASDGSVRHEMRYDRMGRLIWADGLERTYDSHGRLLAEHFPQGFELKNRYNSAGRRVDCSIPMANCSIRYEYNANNLARVSRRTHQGNVLYAHTYDDCDLSGNVMRETSIFQQEVEYKIDPLSRKTSIETPEFSQEVLKFDSAGNILQMRVAEQLIDYTYDELYQLTSETGPFARRYLFDALHNRRQKDNESYEINGLQQIVSHFQYDRNGRPVQKGAVVYTYDALDRLICIQSPTSLQEFTYDALNRCLQKRTAKGTRYFLYDDKNEIGAFDEQLSLVELRLIGKAPHAEIGAAIALELGSEVYQPIHDLQGNIALLSTIDQEVVSSYRYSAFGEEEISGSVLSPWRFASKRADEDSGLINFGRRYYLPEFGRWLTADPAGFEDGMNLYAFVHNAPLTHLDDYGLITYVHQQGWQNSPWGSPFSYNSSFSAGYGNSPPQHWNGSRVDNQLIPSLDLNYKYTPHYYVNGILNTSEDSAMGARFLKQSLGPSANVIPIHSESHGAAKDLMSVYQSTHRDNYTSFAVRRLNREVRSASLSMDLLQDPRKIFITAFSRGAAETYHAVKTCSPEQKERIIITACGPVMILPRDLSFSVTNLISGGDWCSKFCNFGFRKNFDKYKDVANVRMLPQLDGFSGFIKDHFFLSQTYQNGIKIFTSKDYKDFGSPL